ncbi:substrate-binding and VWA domain-containing protein [Sphaerisporangium corydalis]|uniref:Substrate-binding and VWA domain-containing protein n=1 Tax=Sphaerisporangium corydalis TaxID=1441875 RepID=A0ABV9EIN3_9ACTN|nr:substrate-binding and VWA domain-containing protein [Sphaerisporangium corydalis]
MVANARRRAVTAVALGAVLLVALAGASYALITRSACAERPELRVMASPDLGPALVRIARQYTQDGGCAAVQVSTRSSAEAADELGVRKDVADVWIPEASVWTDLARVEGADRTSLPPGTSIARSPVIMAVTQETATKLDAHEPSWTLLVPTAKTKKRLPKAFTTLLSPGRFASGLAALNVLNTVVADRPDMLKIVQGITVNLRRSVVPTEDALFALVDKASGGGDPVIVASEQSIWRYNAAHVDRRAVGLYPTEGTIALDYPYVSMSKDPAKRRAAEAFRRSVTSAPGRALLQAAGFRDPSGAAGPAMDSKHGVRMQPPKDIPSPDTRTTLRGLLSMRLLLADTRALLLLDVSGSMAEKVPGSKDTRMRATAEFAEEGVRTLPKGSDVGLWVFSTELDGDKDYKEVVPVGPMDERGPEVIKELGKLPGHTKGDTGLYDSVLAAFRSASQHQVKGMLSSVVVFTDGGNDDPHGISLSNLLATLQKEFDPARPVTITLIGYGQGADAKELRQIAGVTNGVAMVAQTFDQARQIFMQVIANRVCVVRERCASQQG